MAIKEFGLLLFELLSFLSCSHFEEDKQEVMRDEIVVSERNLIPSSETKVVSTILNFRNLDAIDYLMVSKSGGNFYSVKIERHELSPDYVFTYSIQQDDPETFKLILVAYYKDGTMSEKAFLDVDNRWGFFIQKVDCIARVTGNSLEGETFACPNNTVFDWNVGGTDLGIIWEIQTGMYGIFFGDTYGYDFRPNLSSPGPNGGNWRSNVLAYSTDDRLDDGLSFDEMALDDKGNAREIIPGGKDVSGRGDWTSIPTAAIHANGMEYVHYFNMRNWTGWVINYSGMYKSTDKGLTWTKCPDVSFPPYSNFAQVVYFKKDGYIYMIGTQPGRNSCAKLARFLETDIENLENYEYWDASSSEWVKGDESKATILIDDKVGELSFIYNVTYKKWIIAYFNADRYNITMRVADEITGPWSKPYELANGNDYPQLYGSFFHPLSVEGDDLYFTMSMWMPYNVFLMRARLADMGAFN